jgi:hypothetical protein
MAQLSVELIQALKNTAHKLESSTSYQWGHMGLCNCGFLAQEITRLTKEEIHRRAMERHGDWSEQLNDYCPTSGLPIDDLISELIAFGFTREELSHLEKLSNPDVLAELPIHERYLKHNNKADVVKYLYTWAAMLEKYLLNKISIRDLAIHPKVIL